MIQMAFQTCLKLLFGWNMFDTKWVILGMEIQITKLITTP